MRVLLGGAPVRRPAGVADTEKAVHRLHLYGVFQVPQLSLGAPDGKLVILAIYGQARRVVSAVLQPSQALQNDRNGFLRPNVSNDSAHPIIIGIAARPRWVYCLP